MNMSLKTTFLSSFIITVITRVPNTFMFRFSMFLKAYFLSKFIITLVARVANTFISRGNGDYDPIVIGMIIGS